MTEKDVGDGWVEADNPNAQKKAKVEEAVDIDEEVNVVGGEEVKEGEGDVMDIDDIQNDASDNNNIFSGEKYIVTHEPDETIQKVRSYDLSVTYDFYY